MGLSEIAAGLAVTTEQRERGVATIDDTGATLADRLAPIADDLPCGPDAAATVLEAYAAGESVGSAAGAAGLAPITAAKTLHRCGERVAPLSPLGMEIVEDWLAGHCSRTDARELTGAGEVAFALAVYVATHEPLPEARAVAAETLSVGETARRQRTALDDAMDDVTDLF